MASNSISHSRLPRRNARSLDLDDSAAKAAAWVWHLHTSQPGVTTDGRFISSQTRRRRSSSNYDRKATRFRQEASIVPTPGRSATRTNTPMWDCGSNLYDTFELVSFGNRLDRCLMEDVVSITPRRACCPQEHHTKSPLHGPNGVLRTQSLPRVLSRQASKRANEEVTQTPSASKLKLFKLERKGSGKVKSSSASASTRWNKVRSFINVIKKVVVLHRQGDMVGCKRSINVNESRQRPLDSTNGGKDEKIKANVSSSNLKESDDFSFPTSKASSRGSFKLSIPNKDKPIHEKRSSSAKAFNSSASYGRRLSAQILASSKIRSNSENMRDALLSEHKQSRLRRKWAEDMDDERMKGSNLEGINEKERVNVGANCEKIDHFRHSHHHHHHHHHHHYLYHNLASESARLSPETMSRICADQSWLI